MQLSSGDPHEKPHERTALQVRGLWKRIHYKGKESALNSLSASECWLYCRGTWSSTRWPTSSATPSPTVPGLRSPRRRTARARPSPPRPARTTPRPSLSPPEWRGRARRWGWVWWTDRQRREQSCVDRSGVKWWADFNYSDNNFQPAIFCST